MWTLAEASVECRVMSGATAASGDETGCAEKRESAGGGDRVSEAVTAVSHARKIAPMRFPISALAPSSVIAKSAMAHTPSALAIPGPSPNRSNNA